MSAKSDDEDEVRVNKALKGSTVDQRRQSIISTESGAYIGGNVSVGGDFVGRDQISHAVKVGTQRQESLAASEEEQSVDEIFGQLTKLGEASKDPKYALEQVQSLKKLIAELGPDTDLEVAENIERIITVVPNSEPLVARIFADDDVLARSGRVTRFIVDNLGYKD